MADLHHGHHDTVVEEREGPATALIVLIVIALVAFLIWLFAFSGVFGGDGDGDVTINNPDVEQVDPGTDTGGDTTGDNTGDTGGDTGTEPSP